MFLSPGAMKYMCACARKETRAENHTSQLQSKSDYCPIRTVLFTGCHHLLVDDHSRAPHGLRGDAVEKRKCYESVINPATG